MKANEAPEKIYIPRLEGNETFVHEWSATKFRKYYSREIAENVEYVRTDAFMKRAKEAFCKAVCQGNPPRDTCTSLGTCKEYDNFVKYMKGE